MIDPKVVGFIVLLLIWLVFMGRLDWQILLAGALISLATVNIFENKFKWFDGKISFKALINKAFLSIPFLMLFFGEAFRSGWQVGIYALTPGLDIKPGIVKIPTELQTMAGVTVLSYLITLTPGTLTIDYNTSERCFYVHWLNVTTDDQQERKREVVGKIEDRVRRIIE